jgi:hypothetical protein
VKGAWNFCHFVVFQINLKFNAVPVKQRSGWRGHALYTGPAGLINPPGLRRNYAFLLAGEKRIKIRKHVEDTGVWPPQGDPTLKILDLQENKIMLPATFAPMQQPDYRPRGRY